MTTDLSNTLRLAAIDIGSNAIRFQLVKALEQEDEVYFKKVEYIRFPLRLGEDVFRHQRISHLSEEAFFKLMNAFKLFLELYQVHDYMICATSAMREAVNGAEIAQRIYYALGLKIHIIDGGQEAEMINYAIQRFIPKGNCIHIDVGGGSTEINVYVQEQKVAAESFRMGSVRQLSPDEKFETFGRINEWLQQHLRHIEGDVVAIGTGGNINKLFEMAQARQGRTIRLEELHRLRRYIEGFSIEERMTMLKMNQDRADVILPAAEIYTTIMQMANIREIQVPNVGLKDGLIYKMYLGHSPNPRKNFQFDNALTKDQWA